MYKNIFASKKAVIFELDGVVTKDTHELRIKAFEKVEDTNPIGYLMPRSYYSEGCSFEEIWDAIIYGNDINTNFKIKDLVKKTWEAYEEIIKNPDTSLELTEGFIDFYYELKTEKNMKIGLVTDTPKYICEEIMKRLEIDGLFDALITGDEIKKSKPDPETYSKILKKLNVSKKEALVFESSVPGTNSSIKAGIDTSVIWDGDIEKRYFSEKVLDFTTDFTSYPGNLDQTHEEYIATSVKEAFEEKQQQ
jgi:beta-phosphoglucomutase-like phosphatase (HAD superfamily)